MFGPALKKFDFDGIDLADAEADIIYFCLDVNLLILKSNKHIFYVEKSIIRLFDLQPNIP